MNECEALDLQLKLGCIMNYIIVIKCCVNRLNPIHDGLRSLYSVLEVDLFCIFKRYDSF